MNKNTTATTKSTVKSKNLIRKPRTSLSTKTKIIRAAKPFDKVQSTADAQTLSKSYRVLQLLRRNKGASLSELQEATGWQAHSVRGFLSGTIKKRLGLGLSSVKPEHGNRRYMIAEA